MMNKEVKLGIIATFIVLIVLSFIGLIYFERSLWKGNTCEALNVNTGIFLTFALFIGVALYYVKSE